MPKLDCVNQQYNSAKFEFDATGLGIAMGNTTAVNGRFTVAYTSGISILNTATGGTTLMDASTGVFTIAKSTGVTGGMAITDASSGNLLITKSYAGSMALTQTCAGTLYVTMVGLGDLQVERNSSSSGDLNLLNNSNTTGNINIWNASPNGKIIMQASDKITSDTDIEILDTDMGIVFTSRWTDGTHTAPGVKKFRIYIDDDAGTINAEEV